MQAGVIVFVHNNCVHMAGKDHLFAKIHSSYAP